MLSSLLSSLYDPTSSAQSLPHTNTPQILSPQHLLNSTFLALHAHQTARSKTRTPHSELVFRLSPNNNIGESYRKFGISDTSTTLIAVKLPLSPSTTSASDSTAEDGKPRYAFDEGITNESVGKHLGSVVQGTSVPIGEEGSELGSYCEVEKVKKVYKLSVGDASKKGKKGAVVNGDAGGEKEGRSVDERKEMEGVILGIMALKGS
jgi:EKC/KEOPS complex subunit CGI121/TPRKB